MHRFILTVVLLTPLALAAEKGTLRAGAARVEITPPQGAALRMSGYGGREEGFKNIHDPLYVRAIVVEDGTVQGAIAVADLSSIGERLWDSVAARIEHELKIPRENVLLASTHTHGAPSLGEGTDDGPAPKAAAYRASVEQSILDAVRQAQATLQPARAGAGSGKANVNVNRRARMADGGYWLGRNPDGPSDKTVAVAKFETLSGEPIAVFINYGVHGTVMGPKNFSITGDLPGATARYVENKLGGKVVAAWTSGAAGDQAPIYNRAETFDDVNVLGQILGDEALRVLGAVRTSGHARIRGAQKLIECPGQKITPAKHAKPEEYRIADAPPVKIRLSLLMVDHFAIAGVSGEVLTMIGQRLKRESPFSNTVMVTNCNGSSGYVPDDAAYAIISYEITSAAVKKGCAESGIVNGLLELMERQ